MVLDTNKRTIAKTLTNKAMEICLSSIILAILGLPREMVIGFPILAELLQIGIYVLNERIWSRVEWETSHELHLCESCKQRIKCPCPFHEQLLNGSEKNGKEKS